MKTENKNRKLQIKNSNYSKPPSPEAVYYPRQSRSLIGYNEPLRRD